MVACVDTSSLNDVLNGIAEWGVHVSFIYNMKGWKIIDAGTEVFMTARDCYFHE